MPSSFWISRTVSQLCSALLSWRGRTAFGLALALLYSPADAAQPSTPGQSGKLLFAATQSAAQEVLSLTDSTIQIPAFTEVEEGLVTTTIEIAGQPFEMQLEKHSLRADGFQLLAQLKPYGKYVPVEAPPVQTYKGTVVALGARVRATLVDGKMTAIIFAGDEAYGVEPLDSVLANAPVGAHIVYRANDWVDTHNRTCGVDHHDNMGHFEDLDPELMDGGVAGTGLKVIDIAIEADYEYFLKNSSNVAATLTDMETIMNGVEAIYENPATAITYEITQALVDAASPSDYTASNSQTRLCEFRARWNTSPQTQIQRDLAHLFTGKDLDSNVIGIAYVGVVCNTNANDPSCATAGGSVAYGLAESKWGNASLTARIALHAHEIGHNWSAQHCNNCTNCTNCCRIMCSGLGGCTGILDSFGCFSESQILTHRNSRTCLADLADPQQLPFTDDFSTSTLSTAKWSYNIGGQILDTAVGEPSGTFSLALDAAGSGPYQDDDIRTNFINTAGQTSVNLSYLVERIGVESGEQLVVEYYGTNAAWNEINRITSNGIDQTSFVSFTHPLPANAMFSEFRVRFRPEVNETNDKWYIDNVSVSTGGGGGTAATITQEPQSQTVCQGSPASFSVTATGTAPISYQWMRNNVNIIGATSSTYSIPSTTTTSAGNYTVTVSNSFGSDLSAVATLTVLTNTSCNDGLFCNGVETCSAGACQPGTPPNCNDNVPCTLDSCNVATDSCSHVVSNAACDDGLYCNGTETCSAGACQPGTPPNCNDNIACTTDACNETSNSCTHTPNNTACDDDLYCNGAETCNVSTGCQAGTDPCAPDPCDEASDSCEDDTGGDASVWMVFSTLTSVPGIGIAHDEDIVSYDPTTGTWSMIFDGGDVGIASLAIDGLAFLPNGNILLSFATSGNVPGMTGGPSSTGVDDSDIVQFAPITLGNVTRGAFSFYFDGSDVGLTSDDEDIDAITIDNLGRIVISTLGTVSVTGLTGSDEDLIAFNAFTLGSNTTGTFSMLLDGSDVLLSTTDDEDLDAASWTSSGAIGLSTLGNYSVFGASGSDEDVFLFNPTLLGPTTSGSFAPLLDLSALGISTASDVVAMEIVE